jgi:hypothetical protein
MNYYPKRLVQLIGVVGWLLTVVALSLLYLLICLIRRRTGSSNFRLQSFEEHVTAVEMVLIQGKAEGGGSNTDVG